jgi:hypothetical protein
MRRILPLVLILFGMLGVVGGAAVFGIFLSYPTPAEHPTPITSARMAAEGPRSVSLKIPPLPTADLCRAIITFGYSTEYYETRLGSNPYYNIKGSLRVSGPNETITHQEDFFVTWENSNADPKGDGTLRAESEPGAAQVFIHGKGRYRTKTFKVPANSPLTATFSLPSQDADTGSLKDVQIQVVRGAVDEDYYRNLRVNGPTYGLAVIGGGALILAAGLVLRRISSH